MTDPQRQHLINFYGFDGDLIDRALKLLPEGKKVYYDVRRTLTAMEAFQLDLETIIEFFYKKEALN